MKITLPYLVGACFAFVYSIVCASAPESIIVWHTTIGEERTGPGSSVSPLHASGTTDGMIVFALADGEGADDNNRFEIVGDELRAAESLSEGQYSVRLAATDSEDRSHEEVFTISVVPGSVEPGISANDGHSLLLAADGNVYTFGWGSQGRLGHGDTQSRSVPTPIEHEKLDGYLIIDVAAGSSHSVLLASDGTVFTFGWGFEGRLGHGDTERRLVPTPIEHENLSGHRITRIAAGYSQTVLLSADGTVFTFGRGAWLGHGDDRDDKLVPTPIEYAGLSSSTIIDIAAGSEHVVLLSSDGEVFTFGHGWSGRLGHGDIENRFVPTKIEHASLAGHPVRKIAAGIAHTVLLAEDGTIFVFGAGHSGTLGLGDLDGRLVPTALQHDNLAGHTITDISAGAATMLLSSDSTVFTFGPGGDGRLGHGDTENRAVPTPIENANLSGHTPIAVSGRGRHSLIMVSDGAVFSFGRGRSNELGHGDTNDRLVPEEIPTVWLLPETPDRTATIDISGEGQGSIRVNGEPIVDYPHSLTVAKGTTLLIEAVPDYGFVFEGWSGSISGTAPERTVTIASNQTIVATFSLAVSPEFIFVWNRTIGNKRTGVDAPVSRLLATGLINDTFSFSLVPGEGDQDNGKFLVVDDTLRTASSLPVGVYAIRLRATNQNDLSLERPLTISVIPGVVEPMVAAGQWHTVVLSSEGTVFTFGSGAAGSLGHGDSDPRHVPIPIEYEGIAGHAIVQVAAGQYHTVLLSADGRVFTFGWGNLGALGHGDLLSRDVPTEITHENLDGNSIKAIAAGSSYTVLLSSDGTVFTFGSGFHGQLGHGDSGNRTVPTPIEADSLAGHAIVEIAAGAAHTLLRAIDGTTFSFGHAASGRLGQAEIQNNRIPTKIDHEILSGKTITGISAGGAHSLILTSDGTVFTFGRGLEGQLGHGDMAARMVPTRIEDESLSEHTVIKAALGDNHTILLTSEGESFTFGAGADGRLGSGETENSLVPVLVEHQNLSGHTLSGAAAGASHTILLSEDATVFTFGSGISGRLGHGDTENRLVPTAIQFFRLPGYRMIEVNRTGNGEGIIMVNTLAPPEYPYRTQFPKGDSIDVEAVPAKDSVFGGWSGALDGFSRLQTITLDTDLSITGAFTDEPGRFASAMEGSGLTGADAIPEAIPFQDGVENLLKYAFNMDLAAPDRSTLTPGGIETKGLPVASVGWVGRTGPALRIEFIRRRESGLIYTTLVSTDLNTWEAITTQPTVHQIDSEWQRAMIIVPLSQFSTNHLFAKVHVTLP